jgi:hypothetical protein
MADLTNNAFVLSFALHLRKIHMKQIICSKQLLVKMIREEERLLNGYVSWMLGNFGCRLWVSRLFNRLHRQWRPIKYQFGDRWQVRLHIWHMPTNYNRGYEQTEHLRQVGALVAHSDKQKQWRFVAAKNVAFVHHHHPCSLDMAPLKFLLLTENEIAANTGLLPDVPTIQEQSPTILTYDTKKPIPLASVATAETVDMLHCFRKILEIPFLKKKCTLVQALRLCTGRTDHRGSRGIALLFHNQQH